MQDPSRQKRRLQYLLDLITASDLPALREYISSNAIPCTHFPMPIPEPCSGFESQCRRSLELLADFAVEKGELEMWCWIYDVHLRSSGGSGEGGGIAWPSVQAVARRGDVEFARAFQGRDGSWVLRHGERDIRFPERKPMSVARLAVLHGRWEFLGFVVTECGYDVGGEEGLLKLIVRMEGVENDECLTRVKLLTELGAEVRGSGAMKAAEDVKRPVEVVEFLRQCEVEEDSRDREGDGGDQG